ncbi:MAG: 2Fe-2S iron-sulfur cluster binding domain-containing protein [Hydrogenibacillus schlegelii]|nr:2Fe-2S iron-sulfur cluster binding domain-containing protein [Hydrogenibacillus schlegelii]
MGEVSQYTVVILGDAGTEGVRFICHEGESIAEAAEREGVMLRIACNNGGCGACRAEILAGEVRYLRPVSQKKRFDVRTQKVCELLCRATPLSNLILKPLNPWRNRGKISWKKEVCPEH